jgi:hypothetical protein
VGKKASRGGAFLVSTKNVIRDISMSSGENIFDAAAAGPRAARLERQRREAELAAIRNSAEDRLAAMHVAYQQRRQAVAAYGELSDADATARGILLEEYFDGKGMKTVVDFLGFMATIGYAGSEELTTLIPSGHQTAPWQGRGYPLPYTRPLQYVCTDQRVRADYADGVILRGYMPSRGVSLDEKPRSFDRTETDARWIYTKVTNGWDLMTAHDNSPPPDKVEHLPAHGKIIRHYAYKSAAEVMVAFAVMADETGAQTPLFRDVLDELSAPVLERKEGIGFLDDTNYPHNGQSVNSWLPGE